MSENKHIGQKLFEELFEEPLAEVVNLPDDIDENEPAQKELTKADYLNLTQELQYYAKQLILCLRPKRPFVYDKLSSLRMPAPPPGFEKVYNGGRNEPLHNFLLKDQFHKEVQRGMYKLNSNDPPCTSRAYYKAAENYALFGLTDQSKSTNFDIFKEPTAAENQTFYPIEKTIAPFVRKNFVRSIPQPAYLYDMRLLNSASSYMTLKKRSHLKALNNFCKQATVVNSALSVAYTQHMNFVMKYNQQQYTVNQLQQRVQYSNVATLDPRTIAYGNILVEQCLIAQKAIAVAKILQHKPRAIVGGGQQLRQITQNTFVATSQQQYHAFRK